MKKKKLIDLITSKSFRKTLKTFLIWLLIFMLFIYIFIKFVYYVKDNITTVDVKRLGVKQDMPQEEKIDTNGVKETTGPIVGNITIS